jgi:hypothetical protein
MTSETKTGKKYNNDTTCYKITACQYRGAPKMKISNNVFLENLKAVGLITMTDTFIYVVEYIKAALKLNMTPEEILGKMHLDLKDSWDLLAESKMGSGAFKHMELEDILNTESPVALIEKSAFIRPRS